MASARLRCALGSAGVPTTTAELCPDVVHLVLLFSEDVAMLLRCPLLSYFSQRAELRSYVVHLCTTFLRERSYAPTSSTLYQIFSGRRYAPALSTLYYFCQTAELRSYVGHITGCISYFTFYRSIYIVRFCIVYCKLPCTIFYDVLSP